MNIRRRSGDSVGRASSCGFSYRSNPALFFCPFLQRRHRAEKYGEVSLCPLRFLFLLSFLLVSVLGPGSSYYPSTTNQTQGVFCRRRGSPHPFDFSHTSYTYVSLYDSTYTHRCIWYLCLLYMCFQGERNQRGQEGGGVEERSL